MKKLAIVSISCGILFATAFGATKANWAVTDKADSFGVSIGINSDLGTGFFVKVFRGGSEVSSNEAIINTDNDKELMIKDLSLTKGDEIKLTNGTDWFGSNDSYSHNIAVGCSVSSGLVTSEGNYVAVQTGTYDFYFKFSSNDYTSYTGTYVNVDDVRTLYLQDTWNENTSPKIHYWGNNVITSNSDNYYGGSKMTSYDSGHAMYKVLVPSEASSFNIYYQSKYSNNKDFGDFNAVYVEYSGGLVLGTYTWSNPF